ncbi:MAG: DUF4349 domain-containing protein [Firmicutes bacterium]|nr:DUF4349 domain-containing protein [Bacillota bacterium]
MLIDRKKLLFLFLAALFCLAAMITGCGASKDMAKDDYQSMAPMSPEEDGWVDSEEGSLNDSDSLGRGNTAQSKLRYIIRTGSLMVTVPNTRETVEKVEHMITAGGGIISESNVYEFREGHYAAELTLRVPENTFDSFIIQLQELGEAANIHKTSEDVTLPYLDIETRINNLKVQEERLREILAMADYVEEVLEVERELSRVRGEIEVLTMTFTHLQDQIAFSTIELSIREEYIDTQTISQKPFENIGKRIKETFFRSINFVSSAAAFILIALTALLPPLLIITVFVLLIIWLVRTIRRKKEGRPPGGAPPAVKN